MRRFHLSSALALIALTVFATAAFAQQRSAAWLMGVLRDQALQQAAQSRTMHHEDDAKTWQVWAGLYGKLANDPGPQATDAMAFARHNIQNNQEEALAMTRNNAATAADLYNASAQMWADIAQQLAHGGPLQVHFPVKQMLTPIVGLSGTPWQNMGGHHATDCRILAQRAQACRAQLTQLQHHNFVTGQTNGVYEVMRLQQCDAAQELYLGQCAQ
jgi:hypothetical protein